ncbi:hypothetical protein BDZ45DRAFT_800280 [Acephala macrosclerotiorum]|nr:hypothetical protein BDZ45DRAFT_800280 [Acephala macrosclerotiorum]
MSDGSFHSGVWDATSKRPIVDGKFEHPITGALTPATGDRYCGPPDIDILITNIHESGGTESSPPPNHPFCGHLLSARPFPLEKVLWQVMKVVNEEGLEVHSLNAGSYGVTLVLAHEFKEGKGKGFREVADMMSNGLWEEDEEKEEG